MGIFSVSCCDGNFFQLFYTFLRKRNAPPSNFIGNVRKDLPFSKQPSAIGQNCVLAKVPLSLFEVSVATAGQNWPSRLVVGIMHDSSNLLQKELSDKPLPRARL